MIKYLENSEDFQKEIEGSLVIVDFYADWCGPCQMLMPNLEKLDKEMDIKILKINVDKFSDIAQAFRVMSIPTLLLYKEAKLVKKEVAYMSLDQLRKFII